MFLDIYFYVNFHNFLLLKVSVVIIYDSLQNYDLMILNI